MRTRAAALALTLALAVSMLAAACTSGNGAPKTPGAATTAASGAATKAPNISPTRSAGKPSSGSGSLIISAATGLVEFNVKSGTQKPLITPDTTNTFLLDPAISPDGKRLVYVVQPPPKIVNNCKALTPTPTGPGGSAGGGCGTYDAGSDLWIANRDGSDPHAVFTHVQPNQLIRFPQWQDSDTILVVVQEIAQQNGVTTVSYVLERIAASGGDRVKVIPDVLAFGLAPGGQRLAYARLAVQTGETLNTVDIGGTNDVTLIDTSENLAPFNVPRYSPDGAKIAFASADQTGARGPSPALVAGPGFVAGAAPALDGLPEDIWTVDAAGGGHPVRIADLKEDLPALTWSGDGKHIYVLGAAGLYDVKIDTGAVERIGEGAFHGQLVWVP